MLAQTVLKHPYVLAAKAKEEMGAVEEYLWKQLKLTSKALGQAKAKASPETSEEDNEAW